MPPTGRILAKPTFQLHRKNNRWIASSRLRMATGDLFACAWMLIVGCLLEGPVRTCLSYWFGGSTALSEKEGRPADNRQAIRRACSKSTRKDYSFRCSVHRCCNCQFVPAPWTRAGESRPFKSENSVGIGVCNQKLGGG